MLSFFRKRIVSNKQGLGSTFSRNFHFTGVVSASEKPVDTADSATTVVKVASNVIGRPDLVAAIAETTGLTKKDIDKILTTLPIVMAESIANGKSVNLRGLGTFKNVTMAARKIHNPHTKQLEDYPERGMVKCTVSPALKNAVKK